MPPPPPLIGTLGEKTLHSALKHRLAPSPSAHEIPFAGYVADIIDERGIIEIQTRGFDKLRKKLEAFLPLSPVTLVYPVPHIKWLIWLDAETGEATNKRKSPKVGKPCEILYELYWIKHLLLHENLRLRVVLLDVVEYRYLNGWSADKKRGSSRCDRVPLDFCEEVSVESVADYHKLLPDGLRAPFTSKEFGKASGLSPRKASNALGVLHFVGAVVRVGKKGNAYVYECAPLAGGENTVV